MKIPGFVMWLLLAVVAVAVPLACGSSSSSTDAAHEANPVDLSSAG